MVALLALIAMRKDGIPADFEYVYRGESGAVMILLSRTYFQMMMGEKHVSAGVPMGVKSDFDGNSTGGFSQAPNGDFVAGWVGMKRMETWCGDADYSGYVTVAGAACPGGGVLFEYGLSDGTRNDARWLPRMAAIVGMPRTDADFGEARIRYGKADGYGKVHSLQVILGNGTNNIKMSEAFYPVMSLDKINCTGHWKSGQLSFDLEDEGGRVGDIRGSFTYLGVKRLIQGRRFGARCAFGVISGDYGKPVGAGYIEWAPTGERAQKIADRDETDTDRVIIGLSLPKEFPTGTEQIMKRG